MAIKKNVQSRKSKAISVSLDEYLITKAKTLADEGTFSSVSAVVTVALSEFFAKEESKVERIAAPYGNVKEVVSDYLHGPEGHALIKSVIMEAFAPTDEAHTKESKKNGNRPIVVDEIIE